MVYVLGMANIQMTTSITQAAWTVRDAKAKLSEVLRKAKEDGPQRIGERETYIVITEAEWQRLSAPKLHLGNWLLKNMPKAEELELPDRRDRARVSPFDEPGT